MNRVRLPLLLLTAIIVLLPACQFWRRTAPPPPVAPAPAAPPRDVLALLRAEAAQLQSTVEIVPVENPAIAVLLSGARVDLSGGAVSRAQEQVETALTIEPDNPRVLQELAELHLHQQNFARAAELARQSYARSSQLGELCARSWLTLAEVQLAAGLENTAEREQALACGIKPLPRL